MRISIEWFLLDNWMMNYLLLRLAAVCAGTGAGGWKLPAFALFGAGIALLSMTVAPWLMHPLWKILLCMVMALPVARPIGRYARALLCTLFSACLMGGLLLGLTLLWGGGFQNGTCICTVPLRIALLGACCCALLPRMVRMIRACFSARESRLKLRIILPDRTLLLTALLDSGNLLTEPVSGKPVVLVQPELMPLPDESGWPVLYRTVNGEGILHAVNGIEIAVWKNGAWWPIEAMVAPAQCRLHAADAIIGTQTIREEGENHHEKNPGILGKAVIAFVQKIRKGKLFRALRRNASAPVQAGGGADVDSAADGPG